MIAGRVSARLTFHRPGQWVAPERAETDLPYRDAFAGQERHPLVVRHDQNAVALDNGPLSREIQGNDRDVVDVDVLPSVKLGPVGERENPHALPLPVLSVE